MEIKKRRRDATPPIFNARKWHFMCLALRGFPFLAVTPLFFCSHFYLFIPSSLFCFALRSRRSESRSEVLRAPLATATSVTSRQSYKSAPRSGRETTVIYITPGMTFLPYRGPWGKEWPIRSRRETHRFELIMQINRALTFTSRRTCAGPGPTERKRSPCPFPCLCNAENEKNMRWEN